ncbi:MAG: hypothetical protein COU81_01935 [Candidatus Portnoybacteria bacterium CG10_big_fil_rev_8_21_14_0_10_36_7]|uniref:Cell envelope-related transcriptional attenuator domain-containing protein n=1 Tax=Candidatus Portnoybacteria bacterium CG10_big_fil_rev_8_21_14_0_10_36_7 TaxID=1974812 RepID=A0A2M8KE67_9BACT|nr:MAG: hypothetical protein COU81_01935 [Candidatus Portnoybacteria bacterium CG10_big_fil_rev_8_21_14_0_10_36_7]
MNSNFNNLSSQSINNPHLKPKRKRGRFYLLIIIFSAFILLTIFSLTTKTGYVFNKIFIDLDSIKKPIPTAKASPIDDPNRLNILILGIRGQADPNGGLLSDVNLIVSIEKNTGRTALISIPRDLYVDIPTYDKKERINFAYAEGFSKQGVAGGILYAKSVFEDISGIYIDDVIVVNFDAFKDIVDIMGGIDVDLAKPFKEETQFAGEQIIDLPEGINHLDGETALYYVRSRYSTSDFDRMHRQQDVLSSIIKKSMSLGFITNPKKISDLLDSIGDNVHTTMNGNEITSLIAITPSINLKNFSKKVFDTTSEGLLYETTTGAYHLLPVGDNYDKIHKVIKNIFTQK